jgi:hypothetical protein
MREPGACSILPKMGGAQTTPYPGSEWLVFQPLRGTMREWSYPDGRTDTDWLTIRLTARK